MAEFADVPDYAYRAGAASAARAVVLGGDLEGAARALAQATPGLEPAAALEKIENGVWAMTQVTNRAVQKVGITADQLDAFYEDCRANPGPLHNAISHLMHGRDVGPFQALARAWIEKKARGG